MGDEENVPMLQRVLLTVLVGTLAAPLAAQTPSGWQVRVDRSQNASDPDNTPQLKFVPAGKGFHVTGGPAGTFWNPANTANGAFTAKASFTLVKPSNHTNYYGLVFGGSNLAAANQAYFYFVVAQDGTFLIRHRNGEQVTDVKDRVPHASVRKPDATGKSVNDLEVRVAADTVNFVVNGTTVHSMPKSALGATTDGIVGVRINHVLDVQFEGLQVQRG
jgi:hypothetical protein